MSDNMSQEQFQQIMNRFGQIEGRLTHIEENMVRKSDVFQSVLTVQGFTFAIIVGVIVVLNTTIGIN